MHKVYFLEQFAKVPPGDYSFNELNTLYFPKLKREALYKALKRRGINAKKIILRGNIIHFYTIK